jgi:hypothetical protein
MSGKSFSILLLVLLLAPGCAKKADHAEDEAAEHNQYVLGAEQKLASYDADMDSVRARFAAASAKVKAEAQADLDSLQAERDRVQVRLNELKASTEDGWDMAKESFAETLDNLEKAIDRAKNRLR